MLCLSRYKDELIHIGNDVTVMVIEVKGDKVRLGISAPRRIPVLRGELLDRARACESGHEGDALQQTSEIPGVYRDGRDGLPPGEAVDCARGVGHTTHGAGGRTTPKPAKENTQ